MSAWQTVPGLALIVICLGAGGVLRDVMANVYWGKPRPTNLDPFTRALLWRDRQIMEERAAAEASQ